MVENKDGVPSIIEMAANSKNEKMRQLSLSVTSLHKEAQDKVRGAYGKIALAGAFGVATSGWIAVGLTAIYRDNRPILGATAVAIGLFFGPLLIFLTARSAAEDLSDSRRADLDAASITTALATHLIAER